MTKVPKEWNKVELKVAALQNVMWNHGGTLPTVYLITLDGKYIATVQQEKYIDIFVAELSTQNPGKEIVVVRT